MISIEPTDLVLRVAAATVGAVESPPASNAGPYVERVLKLCGLGKGNPWCAAHVAAVGHTALREQWPVPRVAGCVSLFEWAAKKGAIATKPEAGDVFLIWHAELSRFAHTGFVVKVNADGSCVTNEGNTSGAGSREGWLVAERTRTFAAKDRFIRWAPLLP